MTDAEITDDNAMGIVLMIKKNGWVYTMIYTQLILLFGSAMMALFGGIAVYYLTPIVLKFTSYLPIIGIARITLFVIGVVFGLTASFALYALYNKVKMNKYVRLVILAAFTLPFVHFCMNL